jgi:hypothetical protein
VHVPKQQRGKLNSKSTQCILLGWDSSTKGYRCYSPDTRKIIISWDIHFDESYIPAAHSNPVETTTSFSPQWSISTPFRVSLPAPSSIQGCHNGRPTVKITVRTSARGRVFTIRGRGKNRIRADTGAGPRGCGPAWTHAHTDVARTH